MSDNIDLTPEGVERFALMVDGWECCQSHGGVGCYPSRCGECTRDLADMLRALSARLARFEWQPI